MIVVISINLFSDRFKEGIFGHMYLQIISESMDSDKTEYEIDTLKKDEFIIVKVNNSITFYNNLKVGDVITFKMNTGSMNGNVVTHRIEEIDFDEINNIYKVVTKGDRNESTEILYSDSDVIYGQVVYSSLFIGKSLNVITNKYFIISLVITPCLIIVLYELITMYELIKFKGGESKVN